jgi:hypothetical protein
MTAFHRANALSPTTCSSLRGVLVVAQADRTKANTEITLRRLVNWKGGVNEKMKVFATLLLFRHTQGQNDLRFGLLLIERKALFFWDSRRYPPGEISQN